MAEEVKEKVTEEQPQKASHGNTRLPFGLCKRYGITLPEDATPRDAWNALEDKKGITPDKVYESLSQRKKSSASNDEEVRSLINSYNIHLTDDGKLRLRPAGGRLTDEDDEKIKSRKQEIVSYLSKEKQEKERRLSEYKSIPGLLEIKKAINTNERIYEASQKAFETEEYDINRSKEKRQDINALKAKYPKAAAILEAEDFSDSYNSMKSSLGREAVSKILNGEDYEKVISQMKKEWAKIEENRLWEYV